MNITFKTKNNFFDREKVMNYFGRSGTHTLKALSRIGAFVRQRARTLLRRRKRCSEADEAPSVHTSDSTISLKNIQFAYDFQTASVVVGSVLVNTSSKRGSVPVPQLLELGGDTTRDGKTLHYAKHPWMAPALEAERSSLPSHWSAELKAA